MLRLFPFNYLFLSLCKKVDPYYSANLMILLSRANAEEAITKMVQQKYFCRNAVCFRRSLRKYLIIYGILFKIDNFCFSKFTGRAWHGYWCPRPHGNDRAAPRCSSSIQNLTINLFFNIYYVKFRTNSCVQTWKVCQIWKKCLKVDDEQSARILVKYCCNLICLDIRDDRGKTPVRHQSVFLNRNNFQIFNVINQIWSIVYIFCNEKNVWFWIQVDVARDNNSEAVLDVFADRAGFGCRR